MSKINPTIPSTKTLRIIVPDYNASVSFTSTATIPNTTGNFIIACEEGEPIIISGTRYINYHAGGARLNNPSEDIEENDSDPIYVNSGNASGKNDNY